ncbi:hypothetical protein DPEC_G00112410 [Dallia pectoralis]|uniref:Uncharacterized protein n=1 Tax=Dallia pectoralis TaxID=75939 RepID=A0ACC2GTG8_DALPE|nr:hypothetical protein DPEC_G00112410 [Dallia pectoralis]
MNNLSERKPTRLPYQSAGAGSLCGEADPKPYLSIRKTGSKRSSGVRGCQSDFPSGPAIRWGMEAAWVSLEKREYRRVYSLTLPLFRSGNLDCPRTRESGAMAAEARGDEEEETGHWVKTRKEKRQLVKRGACE